MLIRHI